MDNATASFLGGLIGAVIGIFVLTTLFEWALFKRIMDDPLHGKVSSVVAAFVTAVGLYTLSKPWAIGYALMIYGIAAAVVGVFAWRRGTKLRGETDETNAADIFR